MISFQKVTKRFGGKTAVSNLTFETKGGEIIGFVGPNGAGKTTTMRLITGYLQPTEGTITVHSLHPIENRIQALHHIGYLPENNPLYSDMKVIEYLQFVADLKKEQSLPTVIKNVHLEDILTSKIEELSRGYKQRVGLAAALCGDPDILILDEPTSGLDPLEQEKIRTLIKGLARKTTVIFSTHILSEVEDIANRLIIINNGSVVFDGMKPKGKGAVEKLFKKLIKY